MTNFEDWEETVEELTKQLYTLVEQFEEFKVSPSKTCEFNATIGDMLLLTQVILAGIVQLAHTLQDENDPEEIPMDARIPAMLGIVRAESFIRTFVSQTREQMADEIIRKDDLV